MCDTSVGANWRGVCAGMVLLVSSAWLASGAPPKSAKSPRPTTRQPADEARSAAGKAARSRETPADKSRGTIPHEAACRKLAARIEESLNRGDAKVIDEALDGDALVGRAMRGMDLSDKDREEIREAVTRELQLGPTIVQAMGTEGSYKFLHLRGEKGRVRMLFRMLMGSESALNYHECLIQFDRQARPRIADVYTFANGETISAELRRRLLALAAAKSNRLAEATPFERDFMLHLKQIRQFEELSGRDNAAAIQAYHQLPDSIKATKFALTLWLTAALRGGVMDEYRRALEAFARFFPNDPATTMHQIDLHLFNRQFDEAQQAIDTLEKRVGDDPYLDVMRGSVELMRPAAKPARRYAEAAIEQEPELIAGHLVLVAALLLDKDYVDLPQALDALAAIPGAPDVPVDTDAAYAEFRESPAYRNWRTLKQETKAL